MCTIFMGHVIIYEFVNGIYCRLPGLLFGFPRLYLFPNEYEGVWFGLCSSGRYAHGAVFMFGLKYNYFWNF